MTRPLAPRPTPRAAAGFERRIDGCRVSLKQVQSAFDDPGSDAPHVVLVHGMVDSGATWLPLLPLLPQLHVWVAEMPWSGLDGVHWPHVMPATEWWRTALALCPVRPALCVGHSFGALVLLDWALTTPQPQIDALSLLAPFFCGRHRAIEWDELNRFAHNVPQRLSEGLRARLGPALPSPTLVDGLARRLSARCMPDAVIELMRLFLKTRHADPTRLRLPLQVLVGAQDGDLVRQSCSDLRLAAAGLPSATFHEWAGCGHHPMHESPARLALLLREQAGAASPPSRLTTTTTESPECLPA
ncbi:MAG: alpha/beta hydrolase [Rubrivivax sp.]|nr:alpha/beta hydrolase [Rubrivivax sp.]